MQRLGVKGLISILFFNSIPRLGVTDGLFSTKWLLALWVQEYIIKLDDKLLIKQPSGKVILHLFVKSAQKHS